MRKRFVASISVRLILSTGVLLACASSSYAADDFVQVQLNTGKAGPRAVEALTERSILRDYRFAWSSLAQALQSSTTDPLNGAFSGEAAEWLRRTVASQQESHISRRYTDQTHQLEAVFYAPEGDVMELHDTAQYQVQILDGDKSIHQENVTVHYVVLMTPGADRWVVRQLQAVP